MNGLSLISVGVAAGLVASPIQLPQPGAPPWREIAFPKVERVTLYATSPERPGAVDARANCSASALAHPGELIDLEATPVLSWSWRVSRTLDVTDERVKAGDDFAARVYALFRFDPTTASLWARARHQLGQTLYGGDLPGATISYVWTSREARGETWTNPYASEARMVSLGPGQPGKWRDERVDLDADYRRFFGSPATGLVGIAVMTDADNTCQKAVASFADFALSARKPKAP